MTYPTLPRISGLVHNCALNSSLPTLLEQISKYADMELAGNLPDISQDNLFESYTLLKETFAKEYNLSDIQRAHFTWTVFTEFLNQHNFTAVEILFIPVLRDVLKHFSALNGSELPELQHVAMKETGRYSLLDYYDVQEHFNSRFNINGVVHDFNPGTNSYDEVRSSEGELEIPESYKEIHVYLKDGHYELQEHERLADATKQYGLEYNALPGALKAVHNMISAGGSAYYSNQALGNLLVYGNQTLSTLIARSNRISDEQRAQLERQIQPDAANYVALHRDNFERKTSAEKRIVATILLTLLENGQNPHAKRLLNKMRIAGGTKQGVLLAEAVFKHWDNLNCVEIQQLTKDIEEPSHFYLNCMTALAAAGAGLLVVAILLNPILPAMVAFGMGVVGVASLLISGGMFVVKPFIGEDGPTSNEQSLLPT